MVFSWSLSDNKSPQVSWTFLSILSDISNAEVYMYSVPFQPLGIVPSVSVRLGNTVTFMFHNFLVLRRV